MVEFTEIELQMIYRACMAMGDRICDLSRELNGLDKLNDCMADTAKDFYVLARKAIEK